MDRTGTKTLMLIIMIRTLICVSHIHSSICVLFSSHPIVCLHCPIIQQHSRIYNNISDCTVRILHYMCVFYYLSYMHVVIFVHIGAQSLNSALFANWFNHTSVEQKDKHSNIYKKNKQSFYNVMT